MIPVDSYHDQHHNLIISPSRQSNYLWCRHSYFTLFSHDIWLRKLYHRAAPPPIRTTLGRGPRTRSQKGCLHSWFNSDDMASSRVWPFLRKGFPKRDSSFNYLVHMDHVLLSYWGLSCFSTIKKWYENTSSKAPWIGTQVPEDRLRGAGGDLHGTPTHLSRLPARNEGRVQFPNAPLRRPSPSPEPTAQAGGGWGREEGTFPRISGVMEEESPEWWREGQHPGQARGSRQDGGLAEAVEETKLF